MVGEAGGRDALPYLSSLETKTCLKVLVLRPLTKEAGSLFWEEERQRTEAAWQGMCWDGFLCLCRRSDA